MLCLKKLRLGFLMSVCWRGSTNSDTLLGKTRGHWQDWRDAAGPKREHSDASISNAYSKLGQIANTIKKVDGVPRSYKLREWTHDEKKRVIYVLRSADNSCTLSSTHNII